MKPGLSIRFSSSFFRRYKNCNTGKSTIFLTYDLNEKRVFSTHKVFAKGDRGNVGNTRSIGLLSVVGIGLIFGLSYIYSVKALSPILLDVDVKPSKKFEVSKGVSVEELKKHTTVDDGVWVVIGGNVYDLTEFMNIHPGGKAIILKYAGRDATKIFTPIHAPDIIDKFLPHDKHLGPLIGQLDMEDEEEISPEEIERLQRVENMPPITQIFNVSDFEYIAKKTLAPNAWAYYSSAADDEVTLRENHYAFHRVFFNPRVLVDVTEVDTSTTMLGSKTSVPFYCSATALARLGHEEGEKGIARGCGRQGVIQMFSTLASYSFDDITDAAEPGQVQWFQLYVNPDRSISYNLIEKCKLKNIKGIFVTVDAPVLGNREKDKRMKYIDDADIMEAQKEKVDRSQGAAKALTSFIDTSLTWKDIGDFKKQTNIPIVIKGIQTPEDVILAAKHGVDAVVISNHGGRQLEFARSPLEVLHDTMPILKAHGLHDKIEIYIDGGVRRGTDIIKALCLGAKGVGLGRAFLYANSTYGEDGVARLCQILRAEIQTGMRLLGVQKISELGPEFIDTRNLAARTTTNDELYNSVYVPLAPPRFRNDDDN
ncbi:hypothetical protein PACTADRAFT_50953 [Pachysolen tannophilus NRRL Y-2460]|uniref:L-lactate dehydrogenase (cytochrome) n=1 Tax=Pachysolen tannophilus NRRL Y-2460 TaxID=669874 RepID=A0A1E4TQP8_PACTA|nr:hypothetical protein PACTADRAFT_50953 [Pachysolen tannophilus NRRL Y-2460]